MKITKITAAALVAVSMSTGAFAGDLTDPEMEEIDEPVATASSAASVGGGSAGIVVPLLVLLALGILVAGDDS